MQTVLSLENALQIKDCTENRTKTKLFINLSGYRDIVPIPPFIFL